MGIPFIKLPLQKFEKEFIETFDVLNNPSQHQTNPLKKTETSATAIQTNQSRFWIFKLPDWTNEYTTQLTTLVNTIENDNKKLSELQKNIEQLTTQQELNTQKIMNIKKEIEAKTQELNKNKSLENTLNTITSKIENSIVDEAKEIVTSALGQASAMGNSVIDAAKQTVNAIGKTGETEVDATVDILGKGVKEKIQMVKTLFFSEPKTPGDPSASSEEYNNKEKNENTTESSAGKKL